MQGAIRLVNRGTAILGLLAAAAMLLTFAPLEFLRIKMVDFEPVTPTEEGLLNYVGLALLLAFAFCLLAIALLIHYIWKSQRLSLFHLAVIAGGVLTPVLIFGDIALLSDIGHQYEEGLAQPEWSVLYLVLAVQLFSVVGLLYAIAFTVGVRDETPPVARDNSFYLVLHYAGALCGMVGLGLTLLYFRYPTPLWMVQQNMVPTIVVVLGTYGLMVLIWALICWRTKNGWLDEKQRSDAGASAFIAGVVSLIGMTVLYVFSFTPEPGMISVLWFPYYVFLLLTVFSLSNLYFARDNLRLAE